MKSIRWMRWKSRKIGLCVGFLGTLLLAGLAVSLLTSSALRAQESPKKAEAANAKTTPAPQKSPDKSPSSSEAKDEEMVDGEAGRLDEDEKAGVSVLTGNVRIERENGYLYADKVTLYRNPEAKERRVERTLAEGNVRMKDGDLVATCDLAEFRDGNNIIELSGSVVVLQGSDRLEAAHFVYDRRTGKKTGTGGVKFRVKVVRQSAESPAEGTSAKKASSPTEATESKAPEEAPTEKPADKQ